MTSIYEMFAEDRVRISAKTKAKSDKADLLRLAQHWKVVASEQHGELGKSAVRTTPAVHFPETR
jgi:hypothetical protein